MKTRQKRVDDTAHLDLAQGSDRKPVFLSFHTNFLESYNLVGFLVSGHEDEAVCALTNLSNSLVIVDVDAFAQWHYVAATCTH